MTNPEIQEKNLETEKFEQAFEEDIQNGWENFDKKIFWDIVSGAKFDESLSKEENFKIAFDTKVDEHITKKLSNLDEATKTALKDLQKQHHQNMTITEQMESYKEIVSLLETRDGSTALKTKEHQNQDKHGKEILQANKESQDFLEKLKTALKENAERETEKREKLAQQIAENNTAVWEEQKHAGEILDWFPDSRA